MDQSRLFHEFIYFSAAVQVTTHELTKKARQCADVTPIQYNILEYVFLKAPVTISEISDCFHIPLSNASREIKHLLSKSLIEKSTNGKDRRIHYIQLSSKGKYVMQQAFETIKKQFHTKLGGMEQDELQKISTALQVLHQNLLK